MIAHLAADGFEEQLAEELVHKGIAVTGCHGRLRICETTDLAPAPSTPTAMAWSSNTWLDPIELQVASIGDAARQLRDIQRNWSVYAPVLRGRARLIQERLPHVSAKPLLWDAPAPSARLGSWTLLSDGVVLASPSCTSPFPNGEIGLVEDTSGPPSRAYLKLWEALVRLGRRPGPNDVCLDLGASPGGWTWLLARTGGRVIAIDKAPLAPTVAALPNVSWRAGSAFAVDPTEHRDVTWVCCDVVAYPQRIVALVHRWLQVERPPNIVCTIKFQGPTDHHVVDDLAAIPGAAVMHLSHNKHELTFAKLCGVANVYERP